MPQSHDDTQPVIEVEGIVSRFGKNTIHNGVSFEVRRGEVAALIGGSGTGKTVMLKTLIGLKRPEGGSVRLFGVDMSTGDLADQDRVRRRFGMLFQEGALFSALTVGQNVAAPLIEQLSLSPEIVETIVQLRIALAGLKPDDARKLPSDLSGGMKKRAALARALALEPELLFLDEPTSGLDPINARSFDALIHTLSRGLGLTVFMVTHDLDSILSVVDRVIVLGEGAVLANGHPSEVMRSEHPWIQEYFSARASSVAPGNEGRSKAGVRSE